MLPSLVQSTFLSPSTPLSKLHSDLNPLKPSSLLPKSLLPLFTIIPSHKLSSTHLSRRYATSIRASMLEAPVLWAGRLCIYYALLKSGLAGSLANPLVSGLEGGETVGESADLGFSQWLENIRGRPDQRILKEAEFSLDEHNISPRFEPLEIKIPIPKVKSLSSTNLWPSI